MRITGISLIGIGPKFINMDRDTPLLRPVDLQDWVPQNPPARFLLEAVETLNLPGFKVNPRGTAQPNGNKDTHAAGTGAATAQPGVGPQGPVSRYRCGEPDHEGGQWVPF